MRLTLRTLLAYRDGVLGPADMEDLHRRIQSTPDAGNLLRRIGAVTQLNQVPAPDPLGKGLGADPNSIAEYLDDALQHAQVPELERICLVSDVQLAELADCHTLLATAMNTKVTVSPNLRRMAVGVADPQTRPAVADELEARRAPRRQRRQLVETVRIDPPHAPHAGEPVAAVPVVVAAPMLASGGESIKPQGLNLEATALSHEVPEYLVGSSSGKWRMPLAIGGLAALLAILIWQALGPWEKVADLLAGNGPRSEPFSRAPASIDYDVIVESDQTPPGIAGSEPRPVADEPFEPSADIDVEASGPPGALLSDVSEDSQPPPGLAPAETAQSTADNDELDPEVADPEVAGPEVAGPEVTAEAPPGLPPAASGPRPPAPPASGQSASGVGAALWLPKDDQAAMAVVLMRRSDTLQRVRAGEALHVPVELLVPPATRTTFDLPGGALWTACGPSLLQLDRGQAATTADAVDANDALQPRLATQLCRGLLRSGPDGRNLLATTPLGTFKLELADAKSLAAVEVSYRPTRLGPVVDADVTRAVLTIVAAEGGLRVTPLEPAGPAIELKLGDGLGVVAGAKPRKFRLQSIPVWFRTSVERPIDGLAAEDLHRLLEAGADAAADLGPRLEDIGQSRRPETAALATQLALLAGNWQPLLSGCLNSDRLRSHWTPTLNLARQLLASDPQQAEALQQVLSTAAGDQGSLLYDLISGPTADMLTPEGLSRLVGYLESPRLDVRVLAAYQLQLLTGKNLGYQPAAPTRASVQQWRRDLASNRLSLLEVPDVLWESTPRP